MTPLILGAAAVGLIHTLLGPDHYLPFILVAKSRGWTLARTLRLTLTCGVGHVAASLLLGLAGIVAGFTLGRLDAFEASRGRFGAWLLLGFGLAYAAWGLRRALRNRPHSHWHSHADGSVHRHEHVHHGEHAHPHGAGRKGSSGSGRWTAWALFAVFVVGPCEPLVPLLMVPASRGAWLEAGLLVGVFALATLGTMTALVAAGQLGMTRLSRDRAGRFSWYGLERYSHALIGLALAGCGAVMWAGL